MMETILQQLIRHEGLRLKPYKCSAGKLTIGVGRNLDDNGITEAEAMYLLQNDIISCMREVDTQFPEAKNLDLKRYNVIINMCFNIGAVRLRGFKKMWIAIAGEDYKEAAKQMLDSKWARQVGKRAIELSETMRTG